MKFKIKEKLYLTTESSQSCHGAPILQVDNQIYGPADLINGRRLAADIVASWAKQSNRTSRQIDAAVNFLSQWPDGPQIERITLMPFRVMIKRDLHREFKAECARRGIDMRTVIEDFMQKFILKKDDGY